jgi:hypothetical protein
VTRRAEDERERRAAQVILDLDAALDALQGAQETHLARLRELLAELEGDR